MIKSNCGKVEIKGLKPVIGAELETLIRGLSEFFSKEQILKLVDNAYMSEEERIKKNEKDKADLKVKDKKLGDLIDALEKFMRDGEE